VPPRTRRNAYPVRGAGAELSHRRLAADRAGARPSHLRSAASRRAEKLWQHGQTTSVNSPVICEQAVRVDSQDRIANKSQFRSAGGTQALLALRSKSTAFFSVSMTDDKFVFRQEDFAALSGFFRLLKATCES
jgi:hypothetical protein